MGPTVVFPRAFVPGLPTTKVTPIKGGTLETTKLPVIRVYSLVDLVWSTRLIFL